VRKNISAFLIVLLLLGCLGGNFTAIANENQTQINSSTLSQNSANINVSVCEDQKQYERIDKLAQKYFDYYVQEGYIKDGKLTVEVDKLREITLDNDGNIINSTSNIKSVSPSQAVPVLASMGVYMSETAIAQECAIMGTLAAIDGPMPVGDFLALCVGVFFICNHVSNYVNNQSAIYSEMSSNVSSTCATNSSQSIANANKVRNNPNKDYFYATRYWGEGGGIIIGNPMTQQEAVARLANNKDVWSRSQSLALTAANMAGGGCYHDNAHNTQQYPLNLPHYHPNGKSSHSFYGGNYH